MVVVLPAPFGPNRPKISPFFAVKLTSVSAATVLAVFRKTGPSFTVKDFESPLTSTGSKPAPVFPATPSYLSEPIRPASQVSKMGHRIGLPSPSFRKHPGGVIDRQNGQFGG